MIFYYTEEFKKQLHTYEKRHDSTIREKIKKALRLLETKTLTKGLRLHKVTTKSGASWSISLDRKIRLLFVYVNEGILLMDLGSHKEVYN